MFQTSLANGELANVTPLVVKYLTAAMIERKDLFLHLRHLLSKITLALLAHNETKEEKANSFVRFIPSRIILNIRYITIMTLRLQ